MEKTNDVLNLAKQGNPKAIEAIFSKQLSASNIAVKAVVRDGCLQIIFEAKQALSQVTMVNGVKKVLTSIKPENIQTVKVYSKQTGDDFPKWHEEFELAEKKKVDVSPNIDLTQPEAPKPSETIIPTNDSNESPSQVKNRATESPQLIDTNAKSHVNDLSNNLTSPNIADEDSLLMEKAKWGDLDSVSILLNAAFNNQGISVSVDKPTAKFLEIILKSNDIIDKQVAIEITCRILNKTKTRVFNEVSVSVDTSESDFSFWNQDLIFQDSQFTEKSSLLSIQDVKNGKKTNSVKNLVDDSFFGHLRSNIRLLSIIGGGATLLLGVILQYVYNQKNEAQIEANKSLIGDVGCGSTGTCPSQNERFEALERLAKNYKRTPILIPAFLSNKYGCVGLFDAKGEEDKKKWEKWELEALIREELSTVMEAERLNLRPVSVNTTRLDFFKSFEKLSRDYWRLAKDRITKEIDCGNDNPKALLRKYDFSNEKYPYIIRANRDSEISVMLTWFIEKSPETPYLMRREFVDKNYFNLNLGDAYATCQGVRNEMVINKVDVKQAIQNNPSSLESDGLRLRYVQIICPYLLNR